MSHLSNKICWEYCDSGIICMNNISGAHTSIIATNNIVCGMLNFPNLFLIVN